MFYPLTKFLTTGNKFQPFEMFLTESPVKFISMQGKVCTGRVVPVDLSIDGYQIDIAAYNINYPNLRPYVYRIYLSGKTKLYVRNGELKAWTQVDVGIRPNIDLISFDSTQMRVSSNRNLKVLNINKLVLPSTISYSLLGDSTTVVLYPYIISKL